MRIVLAAAHSKGYATLMTFGRAHLVWFVVFGTACSSPPSTAASSSVALSSHGSASARPAETAAAGSAPASGASDAPGGLKLDPEWVTEEPKLGEVLALAKPICNLQEQILRDSGSPDAYSKSYSANAPTRTTESLERELRGEAKRLGVPLVTGATEHPVFGIEATGSSTFVIGTGVVVSVRGKSALREEAIALARRRQLASVELFESLGADARVRELEVQRGPAGGTTARWVVDVPPSAGKAVEAWAKKTGLSKVDGGWLRTVDEKNTAKPGFVVDVTDKEVNITEIRGPQIGGPACTAAPPAPTPRSSGSKTDSRADDALLQELMGE